MVRSIRSFILNFCSTNNTIPRYIHFSFVTKLCIQHSFSKNCSVIEAYVSYEIKRGIHLYVLRFATESMTVPLELSSPTSLLFPISFVFLTFHWFSRRQQPNKLLLFDEYFRCSRCPVSFQTRPLSQSIQPFSFFPRAIFWPLTASGG